MRHPGKPDVPGQLGAVRPLTQLSALLAASFLICLLTTVTSAQDQTLRIGNTIERELGARQVHTYTVALEENTFIQVVVEQDGVDLVVRITAPNGKQLGEYDSPNGTDGPENVSFVAATAGTYRFTVTLLDQGDSVEKGDYRIKIIEQRQATEQEIKASKNLEVVKTKGLALLGEIDALIIEIRSPHTRIRSQLQAFQLLRNADEKRAAKYLSDAATGVKEFLGTIDPGSDDYARGYSAVLQMRHEIATALASLDPDAALNFLYASKVPADPYGNQRDRLLHETALELSIADEMRAKDPKRTVQIARQSLKKGYSSNLANTVSALREKNPELATELASEIATRLLRETLLKKQDAAILSSNLVRICRTPQRRIQKGSLNDATVELLLPEETCRELVQKSFQEAVSFTLPTQNTYTPERDAAWNLLNGLHSLGQDLDTIVSGGSTSVEKKLAELNGLSNPVSFSFQDVQQKIGNGQLDNALESIAKVPEDMREQLYMQLANTAASLGDAARARQIINEHISNPYQRRQALATVDNQELYHLMSRGKINEALRMIGTVARPRERANLLTQIARQIGPGQKRAQALILLEQARSMLLPEIQAQDQEQMNALFELARAFSRYEPRRSFEIIEPLVEQLNELCAAARRLEGFGLEFFDGEELDMQNGNSVSQAAFQISGALGTLALTNFERAKSTADQLRLPEVRLRAYLEIAQQTIQGK